MSQFLVRIYLELTDPSSAILHVVQCELRQKCLLTFCFDLFSSPVYQKQSCTRISALWAMTNREQCFDTSFTSSKKHSLENTFQMPQQFISSSFLDTLKR